MTVKLHQEQGLSFLPPNDISFDSPHLEIGEGDVTALLSAMHGCVALVTRVCNSVSMVKVSGQLRRLRMGAWNTRPELCSTCDGHPGGMFKCDIRPDSLDSDTVSSELSMIAFTTSTC